MKILFILAFFSVIMYIVTKKFHSKIVTGGIIFLLFSVLGYAIPLSESNAILLDRIISNLAPAVLFLFLLDIDPKRLLKHGIGCSCKMGAKRYWFILLSAFGASFLAQVLAYRFLPLHPLRGALLFAAAMGISASLSPMRKLCGTEDVATTMFYLLLAAVGMRIF